MLGAIVIIGQNRWGADPKLVIAKAQFKAQGGKLTEGYLVLTFDTKTEFLGVDNFGRYSWKGNPPTEAVVKPRKKVRA